MLQELFQNVSHNLFKPLLLFFYAGFCIPLLKVKLEFPKPLYQSITLYLLLAIGWHGGEELAGLPKDLIGCTDENALHCCRLHHWVWVRKCIDNDA